MGGNCRVVDRNGKETGVWASPISMEEISREIMANDFKRLFHKLNLVFPERLIWKNISLIETGRIYSGSSKHFFNELISDSEFKKLKPYIGDIDIMVPKEVRDSFFGFLLTLENTQITESIKYIGCNKATEDGFQDQINSVFEYHQNGHIVFVQVDFEFAEFSNDNPSQWAVFSHSSTWEDIQCGIKGFAHKYLISSIIRVNSRMDLNKNVIITPRSTKDKIRVKKIKDSPHLHAFSVSRGLRIKYEFAFKKDEINYWRELLTYESEYITDVNAIFQIVFGEKDLDEKFNSFVGCCALLCEAHSSLVDAVYEDLVIMLWGHGAQKLSRDSAEVDETVKDNIVDVFDVLTSKKIIKRPEIVQLKNKYYKNYTVLTK